ncbi:proton-conducting transporter transmembrane domain-containing protein [Haloarcula sediminis]|uniref:proton-conducting transporter transmembrane domain-containing protein n=1 Tax=Haloarcula sediminis TaxID=3111777 RepID=UPI002D78CCB7|nr:proton-conducting transporter membrane subunit [Haloarcula sp. CK38]
MTSTSQQYSAVPVVSTTLVWTLFVGSVVLVAATTWFSIELAAEPLVRIDGLTKVMWVAVTFFSGIVQSFSRRYMAANRDVDLFFARIMLFTVVVMGLVAADHIVLFLALWTVMGLLMAELIGHVDAWPQARAAKRLSRRYFLAGSALLGIGLLALSTGSESGTISGILASVDSLPRSTLLLGAAPILLGALVQSALVPFHGWLLSSMTGPTPASAIMHAGFVNAGGVLLARLAPVFAVQQNVMLLIVLVGAVGSVLAQAMMLVKADYKGRLGCSTVAQMSFMILQCGLGFFVAAVTHLIVHGFYKAYLFLSTGSQVVKKAPKKKKHGYPSVVGTGVALVTAVGGGALFAALTGKGTTLTGTAPIETGIFLAVIVVISVFQGSAELLNNDSLPATVRYIGMPAVAIPALAVYAGVYNGVYALMGDLPMVSVHMEMTPVHWGLLGLFVLGHLAVQLGWLQRSRRLYVTLLNAAQANPATIPGQAGEYEN